MNREIRIDNQTINRGKPNRFALEKVFIESCVGYEYLVQGLWTSDRIQSRPDGKRIVFNDISQFRAARDAYFTWTDINPLQTYTSVLPEEIMRRIYSARLNGIPLPLFIPWGYRPTGEPSIEYKVLDRIQQYAEMFKKRRIPVEPLIMPADLYATEINGVDQNQVNGYFSFITEEAKIRGFKVIPWSRIRRENETQYQNDVSNLSENIIRGLLENPVVDKTLEAAAKRVTVKSNQAIRLSAFAYLRERICEANIIEKRYQPIKLSLVGKNKDNGVDRNLPRLYIIPEEQQFPWLK